MLLEILLQRQSTKIINSYFGINNDGMGRHVFPPVCFNFVPEIVVAFFFFFPFTLLFLLHSKVLKSSNVVYFVF